MRRGYVVAVASAVLATAAGLDARAGATAGAPSRAIAHEWTEVASPPFPSGEEGDLRGVTAPDPNSVFAVGDHWDSLGGVLVFRTWAIRFDGVSWSIVPSQDTAANTNRLTDVSASSADDVWAVGYYRLDSAAHTLVERWDGSRFVIQSTPAPAGGGDSLSAVSAATASDVWAVGTGYAPGVEYGGITIHWDGVAWTSVPFPLLRGCTRRTELFGVATVDATTAWAVGSCVGADGYRPVLARWNGVKWVNGRNRFPTGSTLAAISTRTASDVWAVGTVPGVDSTGHEVTKPFVLHYRGVGWVRVRPGYLAVDARPQAVATGTAGVFLAGNRRSEQPPFAAPMTASFDGTRWRGESPAGFGNLFGVAMDSNGTGWAVGSRIGEPLVYRRP